MKDLESDNEALLDSAEEVEPLSTEEKQHPSHHPVRLLSSSRTGTASVLKCNNCLAPGHMKRNCPQIRCKNCGVAGHFKQDCPSAKRPRIDDEGSEHAAGASEVCFRCGSSRHVKASCPLPVLVECHTCHQEGHVMTICPQTRCYNCGSMGHSSQICQSRIHCFHCSDPGHRSSECPMKSKGRLCYQCKEPGHEASQCPQGLVCRMCHQQGHVVAHCPSVVCNACHQKGHMAGDCQVTPPAGPVIPRLSPGVGVIGSGLPHVEEITLGAGGASEPLSNERLNVPLYVPTSMNRSRGRVVVIVDGPYFERCVHGFDSKKGMEQYKATAVALQQTLSFIGDIFEMSPIAFWFDTNPDSFTQFLETGMPLHCREGAFREAALRRQFLIDEMNGTSEILHNVVARLEGGMKRQRGYTPDGPGHVWVQSGVDVAIATSLIEHFQDANVAQVVLLSGDGDIFPAVQYCNAVLRYRRAPRGGEEQHLGGATPLPPPVRVCGTSKSLSKPYGLHQDLFDFLPRILLDASTHEEQGQRFEFPTHVVFG